MQNNLNKWISGSRNASEGMFFSHLAKGRRGQGKSEGKGRLRDSLSLPLCSSLPLARHFRLLRGTSYSKTLPFFT